MIKDNVITNQELQSSLSDRIRLMDAGETDPGVTKIYFAGARTLISSIKLDIDGAKKLGVPLFERTKRFLGAE